MANIDVDDILLDPDFEDDFEVIRSVENVGSDGRATFSSRIFFCTGVVQPASGRAVLLIPEAMRVQGAIEIWTRHDLLMNDGHVAADTIRWQHRTYVVTNVEDFLNFGRGYVHATCTLHSIVESSERR